jgi:hypothetical protein
MDIPGWHEDMWGKFANDYWKAMEVEIFTLESINAWDVVKQEEMTQISSIPLGHLNANGIPMV